jgi:hypothetical protein
VVEKPCSSAPFVVYRGKVPMIVAVASVRRKDGCQRFYWQNAQNNDLFLNHMTKFSRAYLRTGLYLI